MKISKLDSILANTQSNNTNRFCPITAAKAVVPSTKFSVYYLPNDKVPSNLRRDIADFNRKVKTYKAVITKDVDQKTIFAIVDLTEDAVDFFKIKDKLNLGDSEMDDLEEDEYNEAVSFIDQVLSKYTLLDEGEVEDYNVSLASIDELKKDVDKINEDLLIYQLKVVVKGTAVSIRAKNISSYDDDEYLESLVKRLGHYIGDDGMMDLRDEEKDKIHSQYIPQLKKKYGLLSITGSEIFNNSAALSSGMYSKKDRKIEQGSCVECILLYDNEPVKFELALIDVNNGLSWPQYVYINKELNKYFAGMYSGGQVGNGVRVNGDVHDLGNSTILAFGYKEIIDYLTKNKD